MLGGRKEGGGRREGGRECEGGKQTQEREGEGRKEGVCITVADHLLQGRLYFIYDYDEESLQTKLLWSKPEFREAITIHPIKDPDHIRAVHLFYKTLEYEQLFLSKQATQRTVTSLCKQLPAELVPLGLLKDECNIPFSTTHTYTVASTAVQKKRVHKHHNVGKRKL